MFKLISSIQQILLKNKIQKIDNMKYKNLVHDNIESKFSFDYFSVLGPPPENSSEKTKNELDDIIRMSSSRSENAVKTILLIDKDSLVIFKHVLDREGLDFPEEKFNAMYGILKEIILDLKYFYNRPRPNQISEIYNINIDILNTDTHSTPSYPSGHVAYAYLAELILSEMYPKLSEEFSNITAKVDKARIMQGVHFKSDNDASIILVDALYQKIKSLAESNNYGSYK
jgi:hypothetical protein